LRETAGKDKSEPQQGWPQKAQNTQKAPKQFLKESRPLCLRSVYSPFETSFVPFVYFAPFVASVVSQKPVN
jgi:hypothetical protein